MRGKPVGNIVRGRPLYVVRADDPVLDIVRYMAKHEIGAVPVLAKGDVVGIISERDVMVRVVAQERDPALTTVSEVMTKKVAVLSEDATRKNALSIMEQLHIRHLLVLAGERLVGCVSIRDLREVDVEAGEIEVEFLGD